MSVLEQIPDGTFFYALLPQSDGRRDVITSSSHSVTLAPFAKAQEEKEPDISISQEEYLKRVDDVIRKLKEGVARKAVVSRILHLARQPHDAPEIVFNLLAKSYPQTLSYFFRDQAGQLWMGATPEILFRKRGNAWETMSLAGTVKAGAEESFGIKEKDEQAMVSEHILTVLKTAGCERINVGETHIINAGPVSHIKTIIQFHSDRSSAEIAGLLHPTPAVCGLPTEAARQLIHRAERHNRSYYTGYIGIDHPNGDADYFVNLRCMQIHPDHFSLYAGGGITAASDSKKEWEETVIKSATLSSVIERSRH